MSCDSHLDSRTLQAIRNCRGVSNPHVLQFIFLVFFVFFVKLVGEVNK